MPVQSLTGLRQQIQQMKEHWPQPAVAGDKFSMAILFMERIQVNKLSSLVNLAAKRRFDR